jgi:hypothetical protein
MNVRRMAKPLAGVTLGVGLLALIPTVAFAGPGSPKRVTVARAADNPSNVEIAWSPVDGAVRYNVSVFDGVQDTVRVVQAPATKLSLTREGSCVRLRVNVSTRDSSGSGATSGSVWLRSLGPGGISGLRAERSADGSTLTGSWQPPTWAGHGVPGGYRVQLVRTNDKAVVYDEVVPDPAIAVDGLDPVRNYRLAVSAQNSYGSCVTGRLTIGDSRAGAIAGIKVDRDATEPNRIDVAWKAPAYSGSSPISHYMVGHGLGKPTSWVRVPADSTATGFTIDDRPGWVVQVHAFNNNGPGQPSAVVKIPGLEPPSGGAATVTTVRPGVTISEENGQIIVRSTAAAGSDRQYPRLLVRIRPTLDNGGFIDEQWGQAGAQMLSFSEVPKGVYTVVVSGTNGTGEVEYGRRIVNVGDVGQVEPANWRLLHGKATASGTTVRTEKGGEARLVARTALPRDDLTLMSTVTLTEGRGYGLYFRAGVEKRRLSGYLFEYDPGYDAVVPGHGPAFVLRVQHQDKECATPLAVSKMPPRVAAAGAHRVALVAKGDRLYATVDDVVAFEVPSLSAALAASRCAMPAPAGRQVGLRSSGLGGSKVTFDRTMVN